ncbi:MAG: hypothetical protein GY786_13090, partial [Proteobacteria bacterium]|nr:hypothetical protein [Pseudomonadota bacterium]
MENYYQIQLETVLRELVSHFTNNLQKGVVNAATVLSENRDFVLSYYLDHDLTNPVVSGVASQFGGLLALDGFEVLNSKGEMVSRFGDLPDSASEDVGSQMLVDDHGVIWLGAASISGIGKDDLLLRGWIKVDTARLSRVSQVTRSELLITKGGSVLLSTLSDIERVHIVASDRIIVDNS